MKTPKLHIAKNIASVALTLVLGICAAGCAAGGSEQGTVEDTGEGMHITMAVIGPDAEGNPELYAPEMDSVVAPGSSDAWELSQTLFGMGELTYDASNSEYGIMLNSITSPEDGTVLAWDEATGCYWQLFVNGVAAETGISGVELEDGMSIVWYYSAFGDSLPEEISALPQAA